MKFFFTGGYASSATGNHESTKSVIEKIREIVDNEEKSKPFSDQQIIELLRKDGLELSRRTVTKYREQVGIPSSRERKSY